MTIFSSNRATKAHKIHFITAQTSFLVSVLLFLSSTMLYFNYQRNKEKYLQYYCKTFTKTKKQ